MLSIPERKALSINVNAVRENAVISTYEEKLHMISISGGTVLTIEETSKEAEVLSFIKHTVNPFIEETYGEIKKCANPFCNHVAPRGKSHCSAECFKQHYKR